MKYFAGLDVAMKETAICVVDAEGKTIIEGKAASEPDAIADFLHPFRDKLRRVGHEAGALSPWLQRGLIERDLKVVCLETIHVRSVLKGDAAAVRARVFEYAGPLDDSDPDAGADAEVRFQGFMGMLADQGEQ